MSPSITEIVVGDEPADWERLGFAIGEDGCRVGSVGLRLAGRKAGKGLLGWTVRGLTSTELDGLPTGGSETPLRANSAAPRHPNGARSIDHVVAFTPELERTIAALESAGLPLRRLREGPTPGGAQRQAFFRLGEVLLEVIEHPEGTRARIDRDAPARLWGLTFLVDDIDETARRLGEDLGSIRDAVQPGRRIATVRRTAGLSVPMAFITPGAGALDRSGG